jgi:hypothetical protein
MNYHTTKEGTKIAFCDLTDDHLKNIIKLKLRQSEEGIEVIEGAGGIFGCHEDYECDIEFLEGQEALEFLRYYDYVDEFIRRSLK